MDSLETFFAIVIICVDNDKRGINHIFSSKHSLSGSPRLCTAFRKFSRNIVDILESVVHSYIVGLADWGNAISDDIFELLLNILTDNKYHMIETSLNRIMDWVVHDDMSSIIHRLQLFNSCSKSAAYSGRHDK